MLKERLVSTWGKRCMSVLMAMLFSVSALSGCANGNTSEDVNIEEEETQVTYEDLSSDAKAVVDFIYGNENNWKYIKNGGTDYACIYVSFTTRSDMDGCFLLTWNKSSSESANVWYAWYSFDVETGEFESVEQIYNYGLDAFGLWTGNYSITWTQSEKKMCLLRNIFPI
ncbi:MAG: hypothetical protein LUE22_10140 [Oscillospiraceae bacterium]|nr:hypothetical protein [Oscillospiraceae bacterium]